MARFFHIDGRLSRRTFAIQYFALSLPAALLGGISAAASGHLWLLEFAAAIIMLLTVFPIIKRFHDLGHSGWWTLTTIIPFVSLAPLVYLLFWRGTAGANRYGQDQVFEPSHLAQNGISNERRAPSSATEHTPHIPSVPISISTINQMPLDEEKIYEAVANEIERGDVRKGLWTKLWTELDGDDSRVKLAYIKARVGQIATECSERGREAVGEQLGNETSEKLDAVAGEKSRRLEIEVQLRRLQLYGAVEDEIRLLKLMGGQFSWGGGWLSKKCEAYFLNQRYEFSDALMFSRWVADHLVPAANKLVSARE